MFGAVLGSFASAIIHRERHDLSWISEKGRAVRSQCPQCNKTLTVKNLVPIFSWLFQRGKCSICDEKIPTFYIFLEVFSALLVLTAFLITNNIAFALFFGLIYPFGASFMVLLLYFRVFSRRLLSIILILITLFIGFHFYFSS